MSLFKTNIPSTVFCSTMLNICLILTALAIPFASAKAQNPKLNSTLQSSTPQAVTSYPKNTKKQSLANTQKNLNYRQNPNITAPFATIYASHGNVKMTTYQREIEEGKTIFKSIEKGVKNGDRVPLGAIISTAENSFATIAFGFANHPSIDLQNANKKLYAEYEQKQIVRLLGSLATLAAQSSVKILSLPSASSKAGIELQLLNGQVDNRVLSDPQLLEPNEKANNNNQNPSYYQIRAKFLTASVRGTHFRVALPNQDKVSSSVLEGLVDISSSQAYESKDPSLKWQNEFNSSLKVSDFKSQEKLLTSLSKNSGIVWKDSEFSAHSSESEKTNENLSKAKNLLPPPEWMNSDIQQNLPQIVLSWKPIEQATRYRVQIARDSLFLDLLGQKEITAASLASTFTPLQVRFDSLPRGHYYARVSAFDVDEIEGNYSVLKFERSGYSINSRSKALNDEGLIRFSWSSLPSSSYQLIVKGQSQSEPLIHIKDIQKNMIELSIGSLPPDRYEWWIQAQINQMDQELLLKSTPKKFVIGNLPSQ